ncbi:MAG: PQQ-like beta-propeller repeat protein, partial [Gemmataceae bacterium]|nr:PQQ-like beta-propeller repeat protein [Gemmataceae bacterium]
MAGNRSRVVFAGLLGAAVAGLTVQGERFVAAQPVPATAPGKEKDKAKEKDKDVWGDDLSSPFGFPYERDSKKQLEAAREYLTFKEVPWNIVSPLLQGILDSKSDSFFNVKYQVGGRTETNRISVKTEANRIIAAFRKEGLEFYQQSYGQAAAALLDEAVKANYDPAMLADLSQRYFHTKAGAEGTVLLGSLYLERGNYLEAAYAFERLLGRPNTDAYLTPHTLFKAALALKRSGDPRHVAPAKAATERLVAAVARDGLRVGRRAYSADQLRAELDRPVGALRLAAVGEWSGRYGNAARSGTVDGGPPFLVPVFEPKPLLFAHDDVDRRATTWIGDELDKLFDPKVVANKGVPLPGFFPVTTADLVIYRGYGGVYAVAARDHVHRGRPVQAGEVRWAARTTFGLQQLQTPGTYYYDDAKVDEQVAAWWLTYKSTGAASLLYENPQLGALAHDGQNVYYLDDLAVPPPPTLQNPNFGGMPDGGRQSGQLGEAVRAGELNAVDLGTGTLVWTLGRYATSSKSVRLANPAQATPPATEEDADKITSAFHLCLNAVFLGPPLPLNGRLYVLVEQAGAVRLLCLDPKALAEVRLNVEVRKPVNRADGVEEVQWEAGEQNLRVPALVWQQKLGRPMNPLPGDSVRRVQGAFLAAGEGILVCPTNSGAVVGVDVMSRSLLWAHAYRTVDAGPSSPGNMGMRGGRPPRFNPDGTPMMGAQLSTERWRAAAPIVAGGRVLVAAYDSDRLDCLDVRTGKVLWSTPRQTGDLYVGGVVNDKVLVVGKGGVRAYPLAAEAAPEVKPVWTITLAATPTGHGVAGKGVFYLPVRPENAGKDGVPAAEIWALNADTGAVASRTAARKRADGAGTDLVKYGLGNLVFQNGQVVAQSATEVAVYPQLEVKKAEMDRRLAANPKDPEGLTDRGELLLDDGKVREAVTDFREAFRNGPPETVRRRLREKLYVAYTELLKEDFAAAEGFLTEYEGLLDVPADADDPFENKRREDEGKRRKRLYLYLLAKGREAQGRTAEAFDRYLALAALGEGRELFDLPDEAGVKMRPDVWARGRIEGLIRKAADPSARAALEARVNTEWAGVGNDPRKLRDFVAVFGLYFPAGAEAELRLAEALLAAGGEDDAR